MFVHSYLKLLVVVDFRWMLYLNFSTASILFGPSFFSPKMASMNAKFVVTRKLRMNIEFSVTMFQHFDDIFRSVQWTWWHIGRKKNYPWSCTMANNWIELNPIGLSWTFEYEKKYFSFEINQQGGSIEWDKSIKKMKC